MNEKGVVKCAQLRINRSRSAKRSFKSLRNLEIFPSTGSGFVGDSLADAAFCDFVVAGLVSYPFPCPAPSTNNDMGR
jgi:hypothetical protein